MENTNKKLSIMAVIITVCMIVMAVTMVANNISGRLIPIGTKSASISTGEYSYSFNTKSSDRNNRETVRETSRYIIIKRVHKTEIENTGVFVKEVKIDKISKDEIINIRIEKKIAKHPSRQ